MGRTLALLALVISSIGPVPCARADGPVVLARLPAERHDEMIAALRLELAGRAAVVDGAVVVDDMTTELLREEAGAAGATHVVWIAFPGGALRPAEVRVLRLDRTAAAHGMTPQAWDVVDARLVAVIAGSLMDSAAASASGARAETEAEVEVEAETGTEAGRRPETEPASGSATERVADAETGSGVASDVTAPVAAGEVEPGDVQLAPTSRPARRFSLFVGTGVGHASGPSGELALDLLPYELGFYGRVSEWASIGVRLRVGALGVSSIAGFVLQGRIGLPSILVSFRESLGTAAAIEVGVHAEGGLYLYGYNFDAWSFGLGVGAFATLELGRTTGIQLDYSLDVFGFGGTGSYAWGIGTLSYVHRWD